MDYADRSCFIRTGYVVRIGLLGLACLVVASCSESVGPKGFAAPYFDEAWPGQWADVGRDCPVNAPAYDIPADARGSLPPGGFDGIWADLARRAPGGWGGVFLVDGVFTMYMLDPSQKQAALNFLRSEDFPIPIPNSVVVRQGRWDFAQMFDWARYLRSSVYHGVEGVWFADIQEARNRLEYGVVDEPTRRRVEEVLTALEVPCFLVALHGPGD